MRRLRLRAAHVRVALAYWIFCGLGSCLVPLNAPRLHFWSCIQVYREVAHFLGDFDRKFDVRNWKESQRVNSAEEFVAPAGDLEHALWQLVWMRDASRVSLHNEAQSVIRELLGEEAKSSWGGQTQLLQALGAPVEVLWHGSVRRGTSAHLEDDVFGRHLVSDADVVLVFEPEQFKAAELRTRLLEWLRHRTKGMNGTEISEARYGLELRTEKIVMDVIPAARLCDEYMKIWDDTEKCHVSNSPVRVQQALEEWAQLSPCRRATVVLCKLWNRQLKELFGDSMKGVHVELLLQRYQALRALSAHCQSPTAPANWTGREMNVSDALAADLRKHVKHSLDVLMKARMRPFDKDTVVPALERLFGSKMKEAPWQEKQFERNKGIVLNCQAGLDKQRDDEQAAGRP